MYRAAFILLFIIPFVGSAQELKKVRDYNEKNGCTEIYQVLKANPSIKYGTYKKVNYREVLLITGYFKNGQRDSLWKEYNPDTRELMVTGYYKNGLKDSLWIEYGPSSKHVFSHIYYKEGKVTGIAEYYNEYGELTQKFDYTNQKLIYNKSEQRGYPAIFSADTSLAQPPVYIGGDWAIMLQVQNLIQYPFPARRNNIQGRVVIRFVVGTDGRTSDFQIVQGVNPDIDREALRVAKLIQSNWIPGRVNGVAVPVYFNLPISFKLQ